MALERIKLVVRKLILVGLLVSAYYASIGLVWGQTGPSVEQIKVEHVGPPATSDSLVLSQVRVKTGDEYNPSKVDDDVRNLYSTGFFYNIQVLEAPTPAGGVDLTFRLQGKPVLTSIEFTGNEKYKDKKLLKKVTSKTGEPLDERKLFADARAIRELYEKAGLQKTQVEYQLNIIESQGRGSVEFEITEAPKIKITEVEFVGAEAFSQRKLRRAIKTRRWWIFSWLTGSGKLKDEQIAEDRDALRRYYHEAGYIDFEIKDIVVHEVEPGKAIVRWVLFEGQQYKVGNVSFEGNSLFSTGELQQQLRDYRGIETGDIFTPGGIETNDQAVRDLYEGEGFLTPRNEGDTQILSRFSPNIENGTMDLEYVVDEGNQSFVEKIKIKGNTKTKDRVIRRELAISPGDVFDMTRVDISRLRVEGMTYFGKVETKVEPTDVPNRKDLVLAVEEGTTGNFQVGAGFSSVDAIVGFAEMTQGNFDLFNPPYFTGGGQKFRLRVQLGTRRKDFIMTFIEPWFFDRKLRFSTEFYHRELNFVSDDYEEQRTGVREALSWELPFRLAPDHRMETGLSYTIENVGIQDIDPNASAEIRQEEGERLVSKIGSTISYDSRGPGLLPDRGQRTAIFGEMAGGALGADTDFYKLELRSAWYFKGLMEGHIIEASGQGGVVDSFGDSSRVPLFDRWYLGGLRSLRGYDFREVGPKDVNNEPIGGSTYWFGSLEYSVPIVERLRLATFYDIGMVYRDPFSFSSDGLLTGSPVSEPGYNDNWGIGVRLNIPNLGPLRLDYAFPITGDSVNDDGGRFQFGVGFTSRNF